MYMNTTVNSRYNEIGYSELSAITNKFFISGQVPISYHYIPIGYSELRILRTIGYSEPISPSPRLISSAYNEHLSKMKAANCDRGSDDYAISPATRMHAA